MDATPVAQAVAACDAPVPGGCQHPADRKGKCIGHYERQRRGQDMTVPIRSRRRTGGMCGCGRRPAQISGEWCRACYQSRWKADKKAGRKSGEWFDWVIVERAWAGVTPLPRQLTSAERLHLLYFALQRGGFSPTALGDLVHMAPENAASLAAQVASGEVRVMGRTVTGDVTGPLPAPRPAA